MKHSGRLLQVLTAGFAGLALTLVLGACAPVPGDGSGTSSDQLRSPLTDAQLQSLANDAWAEAGLTGDPTAVDTANGASVGDNSVKSVDGALGTTSMSSGLNVPMGATGGITLPHSVNALTNGTAVAIKQQAATTGGDYAVGGTYTCAGGGTVDAAGSISVTVQTVDTTSSVNTSAQDLTLRLHACNDGVGHTAWGTIVINIDNTFSATPTATANIYDAELDVDEQVAAGLAVHDDTVPANYLLALRYARTGTVTAQVDLTDSSNPQVLLPMSGGLTATFQLNNVTCLTAVDFDASSVTSSCTLNP